MKHKEKLADEARRKWVANATRAIYKREPNEQELNKLGSIVFDDAFLMGFAAMKRLAIEEVSKQLKQDTAVLDDLPYLLADIGEKEE